MDDAGGLRLAYLDPPYLGCCARYGHHHGDHGGGCWDEVATHVELIAWACSRFDGWALSASSSSLRDLLPACPAEIRVAAWVKPFCAFKTGVRPAYTWEPVVFWRGRNPSGGHRHDWRASSTPRDHLAEPVTMRRGLVGAKPARFCTWVLDLLGAEAGDELTDVFPGTGAFAAAAEARAGRYPAGTLWGVDGPRSTVDGAGP